MRGARRCDGGYSSAAVRLPTSAVARLRIDMGTPRAVPTMGEYTGPRDRRSPGRSSPNAPRCRRVAALDRGRTSDVSSMPRTLRPCYPTRQQVTSDEFRRIREFRLRTAARMDVIDAGPTAAATAQTHAPRRRWKGCWNGCRSECWNGSSRTPAGGAGVSGRWFPRPVAVGCASAGPRGPGRGAPAPRRSPRRSRRASPSGRPLPARTGPVPGCRRPAAAGPG